ncbi:MAG TPA: fused MFS/spermidine synthase [Rhizomicrobium sp.]|nr:fused MFS/spermidine synthase [Rhizomicrobium sp.]
MRRMRLFRPRLPRVAALLAVVAAVANDTPALPAVLDDRQLVESRESLYNNIYIYSSGPYLTLTFGYNDRLYTESRYNTKDPGELPLVYTQYMTAALIYPSNIKSVLEIGFGGGRTSWYLHRALPDVPVTSVELDPAIVEMAKKYFGIKEEPDFTVANADGRVFLMHSAAHYDVILIDAYRAPFVPFHLLTREFYQMVADHLSPGGVVAQNVNPDSMLFDSSVKTIHAVFPQVEFYPAKNNIITIAYGGNRRSKDDLVRAAAERQSRFHLRYNLGDLLKARQLLPPGTSFVDPDAKVLTDDFAPVEALMAIERHNRKWPNAK